MPSQKPEVGMGATFGVGSDRYPYTVIQVTNDRKVVLQADHYKLIGGSSQSENQIYEYTPDPFGTVVIATLRVNGRWVRKGQDKHSPGFYIGDRRAYRDPCF